MSKLNFNRPNKDFYIKEFCKKTGASDWPPRDGAELVVKERVTDLILHEVKDVIKPQLDELKLTLPSHLIMFIVVNHVDADACANPTDHYETISDNVFTIIEQEIPSLLGQEDHSNWSFVGNI